MMLEIIKLVGSGLVAGIVVALLNNGFINSRERRNRKMQFRVFLHGLQNGMERETDVAKTYSSNLEWLRKHQGMLQRDFFRADKFKSLCRDLGSLQTDEIQKDTENYRKTICAKIDTLLDFV